MLSLSAEGIQTLPSFPGALIRYFAAAATSSKPCKTICSPVPQAAFTKNSLKSSTARTLEPCTTPNRLEGIHPWGYFWSSSSAENGPLVHPASRWVIVSSQTAAATSLLSPTLLQEPFTACFAHFEERHWELSRLEAGSELPWRLKLPYQTETAFHLFTKLGVHYTCIIHHFLKEQNPLGPHNWLQVWVHVGMQQLLFLFQLRRQFSVLLHLLQSELHGS